MIHEVDEPPLGVPGELHFDDEEEEVERGGWASFKISLNPQICPLSRQNSAGAGFQPVPGTSCSYCGIHDPATLEDFKFFLSSSDFLLPRLTATSASVGSATREETRPGRTL